MKKILVVFLALAVAAGAFAQGEWSVSGNAHIQATIDTEAGGDDDASIITGGGEGHDGFNKDVFGGSATLSYSNGDFGGDITFKNDLSIQLGVSGNGDNYGFRVAGSLKTTKGDGADGFWIDLENIGATGDGVWISGADMPDVGIGLSADELYGWYGFMDGMLKVEAIAFGGGWGQYFLSDDTVGYGWFNSDGGGENYFGDYSGSRGQNSFYAPAGSNQGFLITTFNMDLISAGIVIPNLFPTAAANGFTEDALRHMMFGVKYGSAWGPDPLKISATFNLNVSSDPAYENSNVIYFGVSYNFGDLGVPLTAGASFVGDLAVKAEDDGDWVGDIKFGLQARYDGGDFGGGLAFTYGTSTIKGADNNESDLHIKPNFWIKIMPDSLYFNLDADIGISNAAGDDKSAILFEIVPVLTWNFLGNGAVNYDRYGDAPDVGLYFKYNIAFKSYDGDSSTDHSRFTFGFRWKV